MYLKWGVAAYVLDTIMNWGSIPQNRSSYCALYVQLLTVIFPICLAFVVDYYRDISGEIGFAELPLLGKGLKALTHTLSFTEHCSSNGEKKKEAFFFHLTTVGNTAGTWATLLWMQRMGRPRPHQTSSCQALDPGVVWVQRASPFSLCVSAFFAWASAWSCEMCVCVRSFFSPFY